MNAATKATVFSPALKEMAATGQSRFGPMSFKEYLDEHGLSTSEKTPKFISVDREQDLPASLRAASVMVFRLGAEKGSKTTSFCLIQVDDLADFFLPLAPSIPTETFLSPASMRELFGYSIVRPTEITLTNLALASGLMSYALSLDDVTPLPAAATGSTPETFTLRPHSGNHDPLTHSSGQVQIDAVFVGRRDGLDTCFVLETKQGAGRVAKHKLAYPIYAMAERIPPDMPIVPLLLQTEVEKEAYEFRITECTEFDPRGSDIFLSDLAPASVRKLALPLVPV
jgi:hypothetical protein